MTESDPSMEKTAATTAVASARRSGSWPPAAWQATFSGLLVVITSTQLCLYCRQLRATETAAKAAQRANELSASLVGPVFTFEPNLRLDRGFLSLDLRNAGKTVARALSWSADIRIERLSDDATVSHKTPSWEQNDPVLPEMGTSKVVDLDGDHKDAKLLEKELGQELVTVKVRIQYDAGLDSPKIQSFCRVLVADEATNGLGRPLFFERPTCDDADYWVRVRKAQLGLLKK